MTGPTPDTGTDLGTDADMDAGTGTDTGAQDPPETASLGRKVGSAARWSLVNTVVMRLGNFAMGIVLARFFLGPEAWGVYGIAQTVLLVLFSASELGVTLAIVRWEGDPRRFAPTVLTLSVASSCVLYAVLFAFAPAVADSLGAPEASGVLRVMCLVLILGGLAQVPLGFLTRAFAQGRRMAVDAVNFVLSTAVTLLLAGQGWGAMSFAWGAVAGSSGALVACCLAAPGNLRFGWDREQARALLRFGLPLAGASLLALAVANVPPMVVGSTLDPVALGFYVLAFNISGWPVRIVSEAARRVSFAGFSRLAESPKALASGFGRALGVLVTATVPLCVLLGGLAGPIVELLYGERWGPAARALPWLMALGLIRIGCELAYDCLVAMGRGRSLIAIQGLWLLLLVPVLVAGSRTGGIAGVAQAQVLVAAVAVVPLHLIALRRGGVRPGIVVRACAWPFLGGAVMAGAVLGLERLLGDGVLALLATAAGATLCYAVCVLPSLGFLRGTAPADAASTPTTPKD